jgi:hypothetical protein
MRVNSETVCPRNCLSRHTAYHLQDFFIGGLTIDVGIRRGRERERVVEYLLQVSIQLNRREVVSCSAKDGVLWKRARIYRVLGSVLEGCL